MDEHKKSTIAFWTTVGFLPLALYVGAYLLTNEPVFLPEFPPGVMFSGEWHGGPYQAVALAVYRWPGDREILTSRIVSRAFAPLNALDREVRRSRWERPLSPG